MNTPFLSIPTFRSMKYLHGVLGWLAASALASCLVPLAYVDPDVRALSQWACFLSLLWLAPIAGLAYRSMSSNQY